MGGSGWVVQKVIAHQSVNAAGGSENEVVSLFQGLVNEVGVVLLEIDCGRFERPGNEGNFWRLA
jgi:hypothetical protein